MSDLATRERHGLLIMRRLHRMVRHGYRPWLGYDVASGQDQTIHLRRKDGNATINPDGSVEFESPAVFAGGNIAAAGGNGALRIGSDDDELFDRVLQPNTRNKRNLLRRLYEIGL